jgi:hypothetical protein
MLKPMMFCDTLAVHERLTTCGGGVPVPIKDSIVGEFEASRAKADLHSYAFFFPSSIACAARNSFRLSGSTSG